jgi:hypothetical protein
VDNLKGKILLASMIAALAILVFSPAANAAATVAVSGYTDKTSYMPGDTVTLTFFLYNEGPDQIVLVNVTVIYPWYSILWGGNETIDANDAVLAQGKNWNSTVTFTIPNDGRALSGDTIDVDFYYTIGSAVYNPPHGHIDLPITIAPTLAFENMNNLVTILTVETVLIIVSAIIIAAAIFLSTHKPKVTWTAEQKE